MKHLLLFLLPLALLASDPIPASRRYDWSTAVGVPGGIPNRTNILNLVTTYGADPTGVADSYPAIVDAYNDSVAGDVIYFPAGTYKVSTQIGLRDNTSYRGAGIDVTTINMTNAGGTKGIQLGVQDTNYNYTSTGIAISGTITQGTTTITVADASGFAVNDVVTISELNDWPNIVTVLRAAAIATSGTDRVRAQKSIVTAKVGSTLTISPGLLWTYQASLNPKVAKIPTVGIGQGLEDFTINFVGSGANQGIIFAQMRSSWIKNVKVINPPTISFIFYDSFQCEIRGCYAEGLIGTPGRVAYQFERTGNTLYEDNISLGIVEVNANCTANVFGYNYVRTVDNADQVGKCFDTNHGAHNSYNLYEGNVSASLQCDGYFGSTSDDTVFRNWFDGYSPTANQFSYCVNLNRFTRRYNVVGNLLGRSSVSPFVNAFTYELITTGGSYGTRYCYALGMPFIGGYGAIGTAQPSMGDWWDDWGGQAMYLSLSDGGGYNSATAYTSTSTFRTVVNYHLDDNHTYWAAKNTAKNGLTTWATPSEGGPDWANIDPNSGLAEVDLDVLDSMIRKGNYNYATNSIPAGEALGGDTLADSYYTTKADMTTRGVVWGSLTFPPFSPTAPGTTTDAGYERIPAGYRFVNGVNPPTVGAVATVSGTTTVTGTLTVP